jgi:hypothetical protein
MVKLPRVVIFNDFESRHWEEPLDLRSCNMATIHTATSGKSMLKFAFNESFNPSKLDGYKFIIPSERFDIQFDDSFSLGEQIMFLERLGRRCQEEGMIESYKNWDILRKKITNNYNWPTIGPLINLFQHYLWLFGYSPILLVYWLLLIFLTFWILNYIFIEHLIKHAYFDESLGQNFPNRMVPNSSPDSSQPFDNRSERAAYSFLYTAVIYFGVKINHEAVNYRNAWGMAYVYLMYVSGTAHLALAFALMVR